MIKISSRQLLTAGLVAALGCCALLARRGSRLPVAPTPYTDGYYGYRWKQAAPTQAARISAWGLYSAHQVASWALIYAAQKQRRGYSSQPGLINYATLGVHSGFVLLHYMQTKRYYDGLACDVPITSSQNAVILMLILIHILENPRRGLAFGHKAPLPDELIRFLKVYHGYLFSLAVIFTFWSHPMESRLSHLIGFFYSFMLMLQASLVYTDMHVNPWWTLALEQGVAPHALQVAFVNRNNLFPMFAFGLGGVGLITQLHGLNLSPRTRNVLYALYGAAVLATYSRQRPLRKLPEIVQVPALFYGAVFLLGLLVRLGLRLRAAAASRTTIEMV